jgi:hypothetical protein
MAIPFSSLRFPRASGPQTWGIDAARIWPRDEKRRFGLVPLPRGRTCYLCHEAKLTSIEGVTPGRNLEADPTVTGHGTDSRANQDADYERDSKVEPGVTGRWGITPGVTLNAAIQPDFSQVEADAAQLSVNTQFSLFYPEKRPFFLEGADLFDLKLQPVYTRTIADPDWGLKLSGKQGNNAFGLIGARDAITNLVIPAREFSSITSIDQENDAAIVRYRRDLGSGGSGIGGIFTDRRGTDYRNTLLGGDYLIRRGADSLRIEALGSSSRYPRSVQQQFAQEDGDFDGHSMRIAYLHSERYWLAHAMYFDISDGFRSDLGFLPQVGFRKLYANAERYRYHDDGQHFWSRVTTGFETTWHFDYDGNPLQEQVAPYIFLSGRRQTDINVYLGTGPSWYQQQRFDRYFVGWTASTQLTSTFFASLDGRVGQEIDYANVRQGRIVRLIPGLRYEPGRHLRLELKHFDEALRSGGGRVYHVGLSELRSTYQINVRTFVRLITQYQDLRQDPALFVPAAGPIEPEVQSLFDQLLFAYKLNPQTVLFVGYADDLGSDSSTGGRLERTDRTVFMKVGYAFVW